MLSLFESADHLLRPGCGAGHQLARMIQARHHGSDDSELSPGDQRQGSGVGGKAARLAGGLGRLQQTLTGCCGPGRWRRASPTRVFCGDASLHSSSSGDAFLAGDRLGPEQANRFARGVEVVLSKGGPLDRLDRLRTATSGMKRPPSMRSFGPLPTHSQRYGKR